MKLINSLPELESVLKEGKKTALLLYKTGSEQSENTFKSFSAAEVSENTSVFAADVSITRDIHPVYNIISVPSLLIFEGTQLKNVIKGNHSSQQFVTLLNDSHESFKSESKSSKSVIVYTSPTCSWCTTLKNYLRQQQMQFKEIDVSKDEKMAERMVQKSGQRGVPQTEINGTMIVGFDKKRIDQLLEIN